MSEDGPMEDLTIGKTTDELLSTLTSKSDYWYNLARIFPRLYIEGLTAPILEEMMDVSPARQSVWQVASEVYYTVRVRCCAASMLCAGMRCTVDLRFELPQTVRMCQRGAPVVECLCVGADCGCRVPASAQECFACQCIIRRWCTTCVMREQGAGEQGCNKGPGSNRVFGGSMASRAM